MSKNVEISGRGRIKFISHLQGYGFISDESGTEYFFTLAGFDRSIVQGDEVTFKIVDCSRGPKAVSIKKIVSRDSPG